MNEIRPIILEQYIDKCPYCGKKTFITMEAIHHVPHFGRLMLITLKCTHCGYKHNSVSHIDQNPPIRLRVVVKDPSDLNIKIIRSPTATIRIPELGIVIEPGPLAQGEITTIEGYLHRVLDLLEALFEPKEVEKVKDLLKKAMNGKLLFTLIVEDPFGNSKVLCEDETKVKIEEISAKELKNIKYGEAVLEMRRESHGEEEKK